MYINVNLKNRKILNNVMYGNILQEIILHIYEEYVGMTLTLTLVKNINGILRYLNAIVFDVRLI